MEKLKHVSEYVEILGKEVSDKVTGITGRATSVNFDLYGCVQVSINPGLDKDGKPKELGWYDFNRVEIKDHKRCMQLPEFAAVQQTELKGPERKSVPHSR